MNGTVSGCAACGIVNGKIVNPGGTIYEDDYWHVDSAGQAGIWPGFLMIKLKRHCTHLAELTSPEAASLGEVIQATHQALMQVMKPAKIYLCSFGDGHPHIHFWVLPRPTSMRPGMHAVFFQLDWRLFWSRNFHVKKWRVPEEETARIAGQVRELIAQNYGSGRQAGS